MRKNFMFALAIFGLLTFGGCQTPEWISTISEVRVSSAESDAAEPAIAADAQGNVYVIYVEHSAQKKADVYIQKFGNDMQAAGERVRINPQMGQATAWRGDAPTVKTSGDGTVYVGWSARVEAAEGASANDLYLSVSRDGAKTFDAPVKVNDDRLPAVHGMHALEVDKNGRVFFAWLDERYLKNKPQPGTAPMDMSKSGNGGEMKHQHGEPNREVYFAVSTDGGKSFPANRKIAENVCPCCKVSAASAPDGRIYFAWRQVLADDFRHIAVASSIDGGRTFAPAVIVSDDKWQIAGCPVSGAGLSVNSQNTLNVVWFTAGDAGAPGVYQAQSKDGGKSFSRRILISDKGTNGTPTILRDAQGKIKTVFSSVDQSVHIFEQQNVSDNFAEQNQIKDADLPSMSISKNKTIIAFIRKVGEKKSIFLARQN